MKASANILYHTAVQQSVNAHRGYGVNANIRTLANAELLSSVRGYPFSICLHLRYRDRRQSR